MLKVNLRSSYGLQKNNLHPFYKSLKRSLKTTVKLFVNRIGIDEHVSFFFNPIAFLPLYHNDLSTIPTLLILPDPHFIRPFFFIDPSFFSILLIFHPTFLIFPDSHFFRPSFFPDPHYFFPDPSYFSPGLSCFSRPSVFPTLIFFRPFFFPDPHYFFPDPSYFSDSHFFP